MEHVWKQIEEELANLTGGHSQISDRWQKAMPLLNPAAWEGSEPPEREWALANWIPARQATYLTGPGSAGKSLLTQILCTCTAIGIPFMGVETRQAVSMYVTCEADAEELHRRQIAICAALGVSLSALDGRLYLVSLAGHTDTELATFGYAIDRDEYGKNSAAMRTTPQWDALKGTALATGAKFVGLDNVTHFFAGNENVRHEVAGFVALLNRLAMLIEGAVLFIGHPNKAGDSFSGSTAWENQVRLRIFLETPKDGDGNAADPDARILSRQKSNYSRNGETLSFRWHHGTFVREGDLPPDAAVEIAANVHANAENDAFMRCLAIATTSKRAVSHNPGVNYAPAVFAKMPEGKQFTRASYERAFERLLHLGRIELDQELWQGSNRHWKVGIKVAEKCANPPAPTPLRTPCADPRQAHSQVIENTSATLRAPTPLYTTYNSATLGAAAPIQRQPHINPPILAPGDEDDEPFSRETFR